MTTKQMIQIRDLMIGWYDAHRRDLPWRFNPGETADPYHVWMSEIMLQQTTVTAVKPYFEKFIGLWPTIEDLAGTTQDDVLREWAGLGYYSRARNLYKCANQIMDEYGGDFPSDIQSLKSLSGVGDYTAAAIRSIAFNEPSTVIDGNVDRVISRLYKIETPLPKSKPEIKRYAQSLSEGENTKRPSCFAQSLMDLGATICIPKTPRCKACPIIDFCAANHSGEPEAYPKKEKKKKTPQKHAIAYIYTQDGKVGVERRGEKGMLAGMVGFPTSEWIDIKEPLPEEIDDLVFIKHVFTHFSLRLYPVVIRGKSANMIDVREVDSVGLPTLFKKLWNIVSDQIE